MKMDVQPLEICTVWTALNVELYLEKYAS